MTYSRLAIPILACLVFSHRGIAQEFVDSRDPIGDRDTELRSGYDALGLRLGSIVAYPALDTGMIYTSNVQRSANGDADVGVLLAPELRIESDWSRHSLQARASSSHVRYDSNPEQDIDEATAGAELRLDVTSRTGIEIDGQFQLGQEERGTVEVPQGAVTSAETRTWSAGAGIDHRFNRLMVALRGDIEVREYGDTDLGGGLTQDNGDRDYVEVQSSLRLGYEVSPALEPFIETAYSARDHDRKVDRNGLRRDSDGYSIAAGLAVDLGPILRGEVSAGYVYRTYEDGSLEAAEGASVDASITWAPTRLTTVEARASTSVNETTVAAASAGINHSVGVDVAHSLDYNLTARLAGSYNHTDFSGTSLTEESIGAQASLEYLLNPNVVLRTGYVFRWYQSTVPDSEYDAHSIKMDVRLQR